MPDLGQTGFGSAFVVARARSAPARNADGEMVVVVPDLPRFDHDIEGGALGLLVEPGDVIVEADHVSLRPEVYLPEAELVTVLHALLDENGVPDRRAWYSKNARATVNACLRLSGHHQIIAVLGGWRTPVAREEGLAVRYRRRFWFTAQPITGSGDGAIPIGDGGGRLLADG